MQKILVIGGCTAVGKSDFALNLSKILNMEIISKVDSIFYYTDDTFKEIIFATKIYFECLKNIFGENDEFINEKELKAG